MKSESKLQAEILTKLGSHPDIRMFRNFVGEGWVGVPPKRLRRVKFGLAPGSADLIGLHSRIITQADVGKRVAIFTSVEVKRPKKSVTAGNQVAWLNTIRSLGGLAIIVSDADVALNRITLELL